ncbi:MAG: hypothetical protein KF784_04370 [Fimbriimonadaceae bacterium]|nr:hypothetical protein [Fimbriimonadaceae bacterium]
MRSILQNEGIIHDELADDEIPQRIEEEKRNFQSGSIKPRTNLGIHLGMSQQEVKQILGKPQKAFWSKRFLAKELVYTRQTPLNADGMGVKYSNYYLFRDDKLYYIELSVDAIGGG